METTTRIINENNDSLNIGSAPNGGSIRVNGDFDKPEEFKKKIDNALEVRKHAADKMGSTKEESRKPFSL